MAQNIVPHKHSVAQNEPPKHVGRPPDSGTTRTDMARLRCRPEHRQALEDAARALRQSLEQNAP